MHLQQVIDLDSLKEMQLELGGQGYIEYLKLNMESYRALKPTHS